MSGLQEPRAPAYLPLPGVARRVRGDAGVYRRRNGPRVLVAGTGGPSGRGRPEAGTPTLEVE